MPRSALISGYLGSRLANRAPLVKNRAATATRARRSTGAGRRGTATSYAEPYSRKCTNVRLGVVGQTTGSVLPGPPGHPVTPSPRHTVTPLSTGRQVAARSTTDSSRHAQAVGTG